MTTPLSIAQSVAAGMNAIHDVFRDPAYEGTRSILQDMVIGTAIGSEVDWDALVARYESGGAPYPMTGRENVDTLDSFVRRLRAVERACKGVA